MANSTKNFLWILAVYALSFLCYVPMLLRQSGAAVPGVLLNLRYLFVLIPMLISGIFLLSERGVKTCWLGSLKRISAKELFLCAILAVTGVLATCGYSCWQEAGLFRSAYPSARTLAAAAVYLFATALAEELAWRGFLLKRIAAGRKKVLSVGITGVIWAIWHIPMWTIRNSLGLEDVVPLLIWTVLISLILGTAYFRFEDLLSVSLLHTICNICFLAPAQYNDMIILAGMMICYIFMKYKKGIKEF